MEQNNLKKILDILPHKPGVYLFKDEKANTIYVGKAKDLNKRVRSYFTHKKDQDFGTRINQFFYQVKKIDYIVTDSEAEALVLESSLIKKNHPRYNVDLKDDKSYPFIVITEKERYPRLFLTRNRNLKGARYFGPYTNVRPVRNVLETLRKSFKVRDCRQASPGKKNNSPCLNYHINLCSAPCIGAISEEDYRRNMDYIAMFLKGKSSIVKDRLLKQIQQHVQKQEYEQASELKNILKNIEALYQQQKIVLHDSQVWDVLGYSQQENMAAVSFFSYREGELAVINNFLINHIQYMSYSDIMSGFITRYYENINNMPSTIYISRQMEGREALTDWLYQQKDKKTKIKIPLKGEKRRIMDMANRNAQLYMEKKKFEKDSGHSKLYKELLKLKQILKLNAIPRHMECYDISNLGASFAVGSMVVFADGSPVKENYRHFRIRSIGGQDDYAMLDEVLSRRLSHLQGSGMDIENSFNTVPDLIIIDGGKGQYNVGRKVLVRYGLDQIDLISIAKREEVIFAKSFPEGIKLELGSPHMRIITNIRDQAHHFAVSYHRRLRSKYMVWSVLEEIKGIGPKKIKYIRQQVGSLGELKHYSVENLMNIKGISYKDALNIYNYWHK